MTTFYLIRHGKPDYTYGDTHGFIGQGHDFAPLKEENIQDQLRMQEVGGDDDGKLHNWAL